MNHPQKESKSFTSVCDFPDGTAKGTKSVFDLNSPDWLCMGNRVTLWASHPFLEWPGHRDGCEMEGLRKEPGWGRMQADAYPGSILTTPVALAQPLPWPGCQVINPRKGTEHLLHPDEWETQISSAHFHPSRSSPGGSVSSNHSQHLSVHFIYLSYPWSHSTTCEGGVESWDQIQALSFTDRGSWVSYLPHCSLVRVSVGRSETRAQRGHQS